MSTRAIRDRRRYYLDDIEILRIDLGVGDLVAEREREVSTLDSVTASRTYRGKGREGMRAYFFGLTSTPSRKSASWIFLRSALGINILKLLSVDVVGGGGTGWKF